jgi:hypothetical protein
MHYLGNAIVESILRWQEGRASYCASEQLGLSLAVVGYDVLQHRAGAYNSGLFKTRMW